MENKKEGQSLKSIPAKVQLVLSVFVFGTVGIFVHYISAPSAFIAMVRGFIGGGFMLLFIPLSGKKPDLPAVRKRFIPLFSSGALIGLNWIFLFEAFHYTSVATATLCYYMAPIFVLLLSPFITKERLQVKKCVCVAVSLIGMVFVSGVAKNGSPAAGELRGILLGLAAAVTYSAIILLNQRLGDVPVYEKTAVQLLAAALIALPYCLISEDLFSIRLSTVQLLLLIFVGVFNTGLIYALYFGSMCRVSAQSVAIIGYIDPVVAVILSSVVLRQSLDLYGWIGGILILGSACISELNIKKPLPNSSGRESG